MEALTVYWPTGGSSCVRVKEFLAGKGVPYQSVNLAKDPAAMKFLSSLGTRSIPWLTQWWDTLEDRSCRQPLKMFYGVHSMHSFLERSTWHSAHHTHQLLWWCKENGAPVEQQLTKEVLQGLPMPEGIWE